MKERESTIMLIKFLFSKRYRQDSIVDLIIQSNEADMQLEKIYYDMESQLKRISSLNKKKVS